MNRVKLIGLCLSAALIAVCVADLLIGSSDVSCSRLFDGIFGSDETARLILLQIRLPRLVTAIIVGVSLSLAGAGMQSLFANPLADPSITGVSAGAAFGAVAALIAGAGLIGMQCGSLIFGILAAILVFKIGSLSGRVSALSILLAGIAINAFCGAAVGFCLYSAHEIKSYIFWSLGSLEMSNWSSIALAAAACVPSWIAILACSKSLNLMTLGHQQAFHSGVKVERLWAITAAAAAIMTASSVAISGMIGFVGLVVPHILRISTSADNRILMPLSAIAGALLLVGADVISRVVAPLDPVPTGVITALAGAPFFVYLLVGRRHA